MTRNFPAAKNEQKRISRRPGHLLLIIMLSWCCKRLVHFVSQQPRRKTNSVKRRNHLKSGSESLRRSFHRCMTGALWWNSGRRKNTCNRRVTCQPICQSWLWRKSLLQMLLTQVALKIAKATKSMTSRWFECPPIARRSASIFAQQLTKWVQFNRCMRTRMRAAWKKFRSISEAKSTAWHPDHNESSTAQCASR